jgi:hypothetical protein
VLLIVINTHSQLSTGHLEVDAAIPVFIEDPEELVQELLPGLSLLIVFLEEMVGKIFI